MIGAGGTPFQVGTSLQTTAGATGELYLGVNDAVGSFGDNTGSWAATIDGCSVADLAPITDPVALIFEGSAPSVPISSLHYPDVQSLLDVDGTSFETRAATSRTSGYRPLAYQAHFWNIRTTYEAYNNLSSTDQASCHDLKNTLDAEIAKHGLHFTNGALQVSMPTTSAHATFPAFALDYNVAHVALAQLLHIDQIASTWGLYRPCYGDKVHYQLKGSICGSQTLSCVVQSPVNVLITDPLGHRIGFDPSAKAVVNELGTNAYYSGPGTEPQLIDIGALVPGNYSVTGVGVGTGPYTVTLSISDEDSSVLSQQTVSGTVVPGQTIQLSQTIRRPVGIEILEKIEIGDDDPVSVAVLSTSALDATSLLVSSSLRFGATGTEVNATRCSLKDVDRDGLLDLVCSFPQRHSGFTANSTQGVLTGILKDGTPVMGVDRVRFD
jgi:hypothetical protein